MADYTVFGHPLPTRKASTAQEALAIGQRMASDGATLVKYHRDGAVIQSMEELQGYIDDEEAGNA